MSAGSDGRWGRSRARTRTWEGDEFFDEDLPAARALVESVPTAELFLYPGEQHLFADSSLEAYDPEAASLLMQRVRAFLAAV